MDIPQSSNGTYELKHEAKERESALRERRRTAKRITFAVFGVVACVLIIWGIVAVVRSGRPIEPDMSVAYTIQSSEHIVVGSFHPSYNSNPPSGGWHYDHTARRAFYSAPVPDEYLVHNLEHGDVWIAYRPSILDAVKVTLEKKFLLPRLIITPRAENDKDISLVAWGRVDSFNVEKGELPKTRILDFIKRYRNKGPEQVPMGTEPSFN